MGKKVKVEEVSPKKRIKGLELQLGLCQHKLVGEELKVRITQDMLLGLLKSSGLLKADTYVNFKHDIMFFEDKLNNLYIGTFLGELSKGLDRLPLHIFGQIVEDGYYDKIRKDEETVLITVPQLQLSGHAMPYIHRETLDVSSTLEDVHAYMTGN